MFDAYVVIERTIYVRYIGETGEPELMTREQVETRQRHVGDAAEVLQNWPVDGRELGWPDKRSIT
jgi:hypothetical protein